MCTDDKIILETITMILIKEANRKGISALELWEQLSLKLVKQG